MEKRISSIDSVKVFSLIMLFICHSTIATINSTANFLLVTYVDTTFMFISGFLCKKSLEKRNYDFKDFWKNKFTLFLIPFWLIALLLAITQREANVPPEASLVYASGLSFYHFSSEWGASILWFASCLIGYYFIFSVVGRYKKATLALVCSTAWIILLYFSAVNYNDRLLNWPFFTYILPFMIGFFWKASFSSKKILLSAPILLTAAIGTISIPISGQVGSFLSLFMDQTRWLGVGVTMAILSLYLFNKIQIRKIDRVVAWISSGSLLIYLTEPLWGTLSGWLLFPFFIGNNNVQWLITPEQSVVRLFLALPMSFLIGPAMYSVYLKATRYWCKSHPFHTNQVIPSIKKGLTS